MEQTYAIEIIHPSDLENLTSSDNVIELTDIGIIGLDSLCRICANRSDNLIPIYEGEGVEYQLEMKINRHFPFTVEKSDALPTHCCYQCASTLLTWHELVEASIEADKRLKALQFETVVQLNQKFENLEEHNGSIVEPEEETTVNIIVPTTIEPRSNTISFTTFHNTQQKLLFSQNIEESIDKIKAERASEDESGTIYMDDYNHTSAEECNVITEMVDNLPLSERVQKKQFACGSCDEVFVTSEQFKDHLTATLHKSKRGRQPTVPRFYCDVCDYGFEDYNEMIKHRERHLKNNITNQESAIHESKQEVLVAEEEIIEKKHEIETPPQDTLALAVSIIKTELAEAAEVEMPNVVDINTILQGKNVLDKDVCNTCGSSFANKRDLKRHIRLRHPSSFTHHGRRRKRCDITPTYFCDVCERGFTRKFDMQKHRKQTHANVPEKENAKKTKSQQNAELLARCRIEFEGRPHYKCEHCSRIIHLSYNFLRHQTIHTGVRAFFCHLCGKSFRMSSGLNRHIKELHYGVKNYSCDICGRCFASKNTRDDHMNIHTGARPFICDKCGKAFKQKASLHVHKLFHTNEKPYVCGTCGKQFRRAAELKVHGWLHTGHKPHACATCGSTFRLAQDLKRHQKTHNKDFQVSCDECGACFGQARYLKSHLKTHRKKEAVLTPEIQC